MVLFKTLFGIDNFQVKKNCVLLPLISKGVLNFFKLRRFSEGKLFGAGNADDFTLIYTGMGPVLTGDAVLYLKETACENLILFGSCGLVTEKQGLSIGSLVSPSKCYSRESFTDLLLGRDKPPGVFYPAGDLFRQFLTSGQGQEIKEVTCSTISSLKLEAEMAGSFIEQGIDVVDMECSAFFSAADFTGLKAIALFYVSDIINKQPFYSLDAQAKLKLLFAIKKSVAILREFVKTLYLAQGQEQGNEKR
jgi:purine-nucleoside phosphorylase